MTLDRPNESSRLAAVAVTMAARHEWNTALETLETALRLDPQSAAALVALSEIHGHLGEYRQGHRAALAANKAPTTNPAILLRLAKRLRFYQESWAMRECLQRLPPLSKLSIPDLLEIANASSAVNDQESAFRFLQEAYRGDPDYPPTLASRAQVLTYLGRLEEAEADLRRCLLKAPAFAHAHWLLARLRKQTANQNHIGRLRQTLAQASDSTSRIFLGFALHKELHDVGEYDEAWRALTDASRIKRGMLDYSTSETVTLVDRLAERFPARIPVDPDSDAAGSQDAMPIFIVGMHRSGTTLLEHLLSLRTDIAAAGELYEFPSQMREATDHHCRGALDAQIVAGSVGLDFHAIGSRYMDATQWRRRGSGRHTDKLPSNFLNIGFIASSLPHARILNVMRDPMDTCLSNLRELFSGACPYSYDMVEMAEFFISYRRLMAHWHRILPDRILDIPYADLVNDTESCLDRALAFCRLPASTSSNGVRGNNRVISTASSVQVRQPIHADSINAWHRYRSWVSPLFDRLSIADVLS